MGIDGKHYWSPGTRKDRVGNSLRDKKIDRRAYNVGELTGTAERKRWCGRRESNAHRPFEPCGFSYRLRPPGCVSHVRCLCRFADARVEVANERLTARTLRVREYCDSLVHC